MRIFYRKCLVICFSLLVSGRTALAVDPIGWTGAGDGTSYGDSANWETNTVPMGANGYPRFEAVNTTVEVEDILGSPLRIGGSLIRFCSMLFKDVSPGGTSLTITDQDDVGLTVDTSDVTFDLPVNLDPAAGNDTVAFNFFAQQFSSTSVTFNQPITTNDNNLVLFNPLLNSVLVRLKDDFDGGNGNVSIDGTASVGVDETLTADGVTVADGGNLTFINEGSQLLANSLRLDGGSISLKGGATPTNPLPNLTGPIETKGGRFGFFDGDVTLSQGIHLGVGNTDFEFDTIVQPRISVNGALSRDQGGTLLLGNFYGEYYDAVRDVGVSGLLPYMTTINDFARYDQTTKEVVEVTSYVPLPTATPDDAAEAVGGMSLATDKEVAALKANNATIAGGGHTLTTDGIMVKGVNASLLNMTIMPHDRPGNDPNELVFHAPVGGDRLTTTGVDVADNGDPTVVTFNAPQGGRWTVNDTFTKTGETYINGGTVILNGPGAGLGAGDVFLDPGALIRLINNTFQNNLVVGAGPFPATLEADGNSTLVGNITFEVNTRNDRFIKLTAPQGMDSLTISGTFTRGGTGNPIEGHGRAIVQLGESFGDGDITVASTADLTDSNIVTTLNGDQGRQFFLNGQMGITVVLGDVAVAGVGSSTIFADGFESADPFTWTLLPGESIGTFTVVEDMFVRSSDFTYNAEIDDAGNSDRIAVGGTLDISTSTDTLDISFFSGSTLANADYTLATYDSLVGMFDSVMFDGTPVANPLLSGSIGGTHRLAYTPGAILLTTAAPVSGDYNQNGIVDAADYTVWRDTLGSTTNLAADGSGNGTVGDEDYALWKSNFGTIASGTGSPLAHAPSVPEPSTCILLMIALLMVRLRR